MIEFAQVTKRFGAVTALNDVTVEVGRGRTTAMVGPNGSGKTTLIKALLGLVRPTGGAISINGVPVTGSWEYRRNIGYMPQSARFPDYLRVREIVDLVQKIRGGEPSDTTLFSELRIDREMDKRAGTLSGGTRQKVSAALAFMFNPDLLIFDEPTVGLDPVSSTVVKAKIREHQRLGKTIILTTHILSEIEELADDLVFLMDGRLLWAGSVAGVLQETGEARLEDAVAFLIRKAS